MTAVWQERLALGFVVAAAVAVISQWWGRRVAGVLARLLLARGQVKWAMRLRRIAGPRDCC